MATRSADPNRKETILAATRALIATDGVDGVSHRKVAAQANIPLGSMTYHFAGREELIMEVFTRFANEISERFNTTMKAAANTEQALQLVVQMINSQVLTDPDELVLTHELYALAARDERYRTITHSWMAASRTAFESHFTPKAARMLDAIVEGWSIHRALDINPGPDLTMADLRRVLDL